MSAHVYMGCVDLNSTSHDRVASALHTEPSENSLNLLDTYMGATDLETML